MREIMKEQLLPLWQCLALVRQQAAAAQETAAQAARQQVRLPLQQPLSLTDMAISDLSDVTTEYERS